MYAMACIHRRLARQWCRRCSADVLTRTIDGYVSRMHSPWLTESLDRHVPRRTLRRRSIGSDNHIPNQKSQELPHDTSKFQAGSKTMEFASSLMRRFTASTRFKLSSESQEDFFRLSVWITMNGIVCKHKRHTYVMFDLAILLVENFQCS